MRLFLLSLLVSLPLAAQPPTTSASAVAAGAIKLDGRLDEAAWAGAAVAGAFVQLRPQAGAPASEATEARVAYDGAALYVGMRMRDSRPDAIDARLGRRDSGLESDWAVVAVDSYGDGRTAFVFEVSAAGVLADALLFDDVNEDGSWDAVWDAAVARDAEGWTAEFRIPFSQLRFAASDGEQRWGVEFGRRHFRTGEQSFWAPIDPEVNGVVSQFGELTGVRGLRPPRQFEVVPYVASAATRAPEPALTNGLADPFYSSTDLDPRVGIDLKYGLTSDLTLTATVNPDFGQVEADPAQVNLGGFELFFEERRPFFVEGIDVFSMQPRRYFSNNRPTLLYTRRIGRSPQRRGFVPSAAFEAAGDNGAVYTDAPQQSTILGAAKVSGRVGRFSVGVLDAVTGPEFGRFQALSAGGTVAMDDRALVEPATNYAVLRARGTFGRTLVGGFATSVLRSTHDDAIAQFLPGQATVGGLDVERPFGDWVLSAQAAGSVVSGSEASIARLQRAFPRVYQRPDAGHVSLDPTRGALAGWTAEANVLKTTGERWLAGVHGNVTSPGFDSNELGFQSRADYAGGGAVLIYNQNQPQGPFQRWGVNTFGGVGWNFGGDRVATFVGGNANAQLRNFWSVNANGNAGPRTADDRGTRGGPLMTDPAAFQINANVGTDDRKAVSGYAYTSLGGDELGGGSVDLGGGVEFQPSSAVSVEVGPGVSVSHTERQYVGAFEAPGLDATFGRRYVFGVLDQTTLSADVRVNWTFTPRLSLQTFVRPFVSRGRFDGFRQLTEAGQLDLPRYGDGFGSVEAVDGGYRVTGADGGAAEFSDPDFTVRALQGNAVLRWEYRPGSALFLVWQQQRAGSARDGRIDVGRDVRGLFTDVSTNVFLVKLSYWLGG